MWHQGWFKFGGVEFFKINMAQSMGEEKAWENRTAIYLAAAAGACPLPVHCYSHDMSTIPP